jgi:uncharacterized protein (TIGR03382 family)
MLLLSLAVASAHTPHDPVRATDLSAGFGSDGILLSGRIPAETFRQTELVRSDDAGWTWNQSGRGLGNGSDLMDLRMSPAFPTDGLAVTASDDGVFVTNDGGATWTHALTDMPGTTVEIALEPDGTPTLVVAGALGGLWCSRDRGASFDDCTPPDTLAIVALSASNDGTRLVAAGPTAIDVSADQGRTWTRAAPLAPAFANTVAAAPGLILAGTDYGLFRSEDDGASWQGPANLPEPVVHAVSIAPDWPSDRTVLAATATHAVLVSADGGVNFVEHDAGVKLSDQSSRHFYTIRVARDWASSGCAILGAFEGIWQSCDFGETWAEHDIRPVPVVTSIALSPRYADDRTLTVSMYGGGIYLSRDGGETFANLNPGLENGAAYDVGFVDDGAGGVVAFGAQADRLLFSPPGEPWASHKTDLGTLIFPTEVAVDPAWATSGIALYGTRYTGMGRTADFGETFSTVAAENTMVTSTVLDASGEAWFGTGAGGLFSSADAGATWTDETALLGGVKGRVFVRREADGRLWIGTTTGLKLREPGAAALTVPDAPLAMQEGVIEQVELAHDGTVFVSVRGEGLFRGSASETLAPIAQALLDAGMTISELDPSPDFANDATIFASAGEALLRSTDRGDTWTRIDPRPMRYEEDSQRIYTDGRDVLVAKDPAHSASQVYELIGPEANVRFDWYGEQVDVIGATTPGGGAVEVWIDGARVGTVSSDGADAVNQVLWSSTPGPMAVHVLELRWVSGVFAFDAFDLHYPVPPAPSDSGPGPEDTGVGPDDPPVEEQPPGEEGGDPEPDDGKGCGCAASPGAPAAWPLALAASFLGRRRRAGPRAR